MPVNPYDRVGIMPTIGDMIVTTQEKMRQQQRPARSPLGMRKRPVQQDAIRTAVDFRPTPMARRRP